MPGFAPERLSGGFFPVERYSQTYRQASPGKQVNPAHSLSPSCCGKTAGNCVLRLGSAEKAPPDLKVCRCRGQSAQGRFPQGRGHGLADFSHRRNNLVKGDNAFYTGKGHVGGGTHYRTCVPLDAGNFHKPRHRIADKAKLVFQGDGSGVKYGGGARRQVRPEPPWRRRFSPSRRCIPAVYDVAFLWNDAGPYKGFAQQRPWLAKCAGMRRGNGVAMT